MHLWFKQISDECKREGITANQILKETIEVRVSEVFIKFVWKSIQQGLFGTKSTTQLKKIGEMDEIQDHMIKFFGEHFELELPPFPSESTVAPLKDND